MLCEKETQSIYAAIKLIERLYLNGQVKKITYKNILKEYKNCIDISEFKC